VLPPSGSHVGTFVLTSNFRPSDPKQAPFAAEAKEFLRKRLIGKHVRVTTDGKRPAQEGYEEREMATVIHNGKNVALLLVENGYASVIRHRRDDEDRSPIYDELLAAEEAAQKEAKGMYAAKPPTTKQFVDFSESVQKAKILFSILQRQKKVPAVVDFVKSGSRFTVLVPRENAKITFVLSGIRAPKSARNANEKGEPFGQEAHDFAIRRCMQRDVEIDVENLDKVGGFIGTVYINRESFAKLLVEEGLASVHAYSAEQSGNANELLAAEKKAKEARKGIWHDWDPSKEEDKPEETHSDVDEKNGDAATVARKKDYRDVVVTNVNETAKLKLQLVGSGTASLTELMTAFKNFHMSPSNNTPLPGPPKSGEIVAAKFTEDNEWYRAKVHRVDREAKQAEVTYIDYGNSEKIPWARLRPLTQPQFSTSKLRGQAVDAVLSFLQFPTQSEYLADAVGFINHLVQDKQLVANVDYTAPDGTLYITLFDPKVSGTLQESYNADIVAEGLAMVPKKLKAWERASTDVLAALRTREEEAKKERRGMWEYGDLTAEDD
jgi:staphylococcal nuclease domain-containing protein 1